VANQLDASFVPVDPARHSIPVSASAIRANPLGNWQYIPPPVRPYFVHHVAILSAADLARSVARAMGTVVVESYRHFVGTSIARDQVTESTIWNAQLSAVNALARHADRVVIHSLPEEEWNAYQALVGVQFDAVLNVDDIVARSADLVASRIEQILDHANAGIHSVDSDMRRS
jgi:hypothetical protein